MNIKHEDVKELLRQRGWSELMFSRKIGVDYSYMYRVLRGQRGVGKKFLAGLIKFCENNELNFRNYIEL